MRKAIFALIAPVALQLSSAASANGVHETCSIGKLAGRWAFATDVGHETISFGGDITALGTFTVDRRGRVEGTFDVTFENNAFVQDVPFEGEMTVDADCTGTLSFVTGAGTARTDSLLMLNRYELWGMSRDPQNLWTYRVRRLPAR
jgi:hypothetical protein